jgi:IS30 family transposase
MGFEIRPDRQRSQGAKKLLRERAEYFRLVARGVSSQEACRVVGVSYRTGKRWRNGRNHNGKRRTGPVSPPPAGTRYLSQDERVYVADRLRENASIRVIARELGRAASTISREIARNAHPDSDAYRPFAAQRRADARRPRPKRGKISANPELRAVIQDQLNEWWSPEQIARRLRKQFPDRPEMHVAHETIYQALYVQGRGELRRELATALRTGRARRIPRRQTQQRRPRFTDEMVMISQRPAEASDRAVPGHWEGDLIIGKDGNSAIGTLVERTTRYVMLVHLPGDRSAAAVRDALIDTVARLPTQLMRSLTWDQGTEMAAHRAFTIATNTPVYFCDPASPWQRGTNENTNGLLRQYFPKGTNLALHTPEHLDAVADQLNRRPRKTLDWDTPAERLATLIAEAS